MNDAIEAIKRAITLYGQLLDDLRMDEFGKLFAESAVWAMPGYVFCGRKAIVDGLRSLEPEAPGMVKHLSYTPVINFLDADRAEAWTDLLFLNRESVDGAWNVAASGRYCDELVRQGAEWHFFQRVADVNVSGVPEVSFKQSPIF